MKNFIVCSLALSLSTICASEQSQAASELFNDTQEPITVRFSALKNYRFFRVVAVAARLLNLDHLKQIGAYKENGESLVLNPKTGIAIPAQKRGEWQVWDFQRESAARTNICMTAIDLTANMDNSETARSMQDPVLLSDQNSYDGYCPSGLSKPRRWILQYPVNSALHQTVIIER